MDNPFGNGESFSIRGFGNIGTPWQQQVFKFCNSLPQTPVTQNSPAILFSDEQEKLIKRSLLTQM